MVLKKVISTLLILDADFRCWPLAEQLQGILQFYRRQHFSRCKDLFGVLFPEQGQVGQSNPEY